MTQRKLTVKGRGPDARVTFTVEVYKGTVWVTSFSCPAVCEAVLEPAQADSLVKIINQATKDARRHQNGPAS